VSDQLAEPIVDLHQQHELLALQVAIDGRFAQSVGVHTSVSLHAWLRAARSCRALELFCKERAEESR
jgi:hypothetical protein